NTYSLSTSVSMRRFPAEGEDMIAYFNWKLVQSKAVHRNKGSLDSRAWRNKMKRFEFRNEQIEQFRNEQNGNVKEPFWWIKLEEGVMRLQMLWPAFRFRSWVQAQVPKHERKRKYVEIGQ